MNRNRDNATQSSTDLPTFTVLVDGEDLGGLYGILGVVVTKAINKIPKARLVLADGDVALQDFEISSSDMFVPGKKIELKAGYHNEEETIFEGIIIRHSIKSIENKNPVLQIDMRDQAVKMTVGRKNRYFTSLKDSEIIEELINANGLEPHVESTDAEHSEMVQYYTTDWDFMIARAEVNGKLVFVDDGNVAVKKPDLDQDPVLRVGYGRNVISFEAGMDARDQLSLSRSTSWDYSGQVLAEEEGGDPGVKEPGNIPAKELAGVIGLDAWMQQHGGRVESDELKAWSESKMLKSRLAKVKGRVRIPGFSEVKPGDMIHIQGFGERFNGPAFVSSIHHQKATDTSWTTDIEFGMDQEWFINKYDDIVARQASGLVPPIHGLQVGVVTNIHEDPEGEDRIKVRMPLIDPADEGVWARMTSLDAGKNRGLVFRPEIGDEVIVGCINDDPRDPVILGMVHSSAKPSPIEAEEENNTKGIVTRSELKMFFDDDKKSIIIETPNGNKWELSDDSGTVRIEDENGNKVSLSSDGITLESSGDLTLKAAGDIQIEGTNINGSASAGFKAQGGSGAELSSSGQTVVKGSLVSIN